MPRTLRCWLFAVMSAMQQGRLRQSRCVIRLVYQTSKTGLSEIDRDPKIEKMSGHLFQTEVRLAVQGSGDCQKDSAGHSPLFINSHRTDLCDVFKKKGTDAATR